MAKTVTHKLIRIGISWLLLVLILAAAEPPAYGYADPGSGLLLWQMLGAAVLGSIFYIRRFLRWLGIGRKGRSQDL